MTDQVKNLGDGEPVPVTVHVTHKIHEVVAAAAGALKRSTKLYVRDGRLVHVVGCPECMPGFPPDAPRIRNVSTATLLPELTECADWTKHDARKGCAAPTVPPERIVAAVLGAGEWPGLRPLAGVVEAPALRPDLSVIETPGYDRATGYLYLPSIAYPTVPERPTQADSRAALDALLEVFAEMPHASDAQKLVPIAALLTRLARPAIDGPTPAFAFDASTPGSGKTLQQDVVCMIASGRASARMTWPSDVNELEKLLGACALGGAASVDFDNAATPFGGAPIDKVLTARERVGMRVLGQSEAPLLAWRAVVTVSGNNITLTGDTPRRVLMSRLVPREERPEERTGFKHELLVAWVREERARLVVAALTILRAWDAAGRPKGGGTMGGFEEWAAIVPHALAYAGGGDVMAARVAASVEANPEHQALVTVLKTIEHLDVDAKGVTAKGVILSLFPPERIKAQNRGEPVKPDGLDGAREAVEAMTCNKPGSIPDAGSLGKALGRYRDRHADGLRLVHATKNASPVRWRAVAAA